MNIVFTAVTGMRNRGVEALVRPAIEQLCAAFPGASFRVLTNTPDYDADVFADRDDVSFHPTRRVELLLLHRGLKRRLRIMASKFHESIAAPFYREYLDHMRWADLVIATSGDGFSSDYGASTLKALLVELRMAQNLNKPVVFLAHSIGPFRTQQETEDWLEIGRRSAIITTREDISLDYLRNKLALPASLVTRTADTAFLLEPCPSGRTVALRRFYGVSDDQPLVALSVSAAINRYTSNSAFDHLAHLEKFCDFVLNSLSFQILLIPHVQEPRWPSDDRIACSTLLRRLGYPANLKLAGANHTASEFKGLIGSCDFVVAERMHAAIAGLSTGVCTMPVQYSIKAPGILRYALNDDALANLLIVPYEHFIQTDAFLEKFQLVWSRRHEISQHLRNQIPRLRADAQRNFDLISAYMRGKGNGRTP